MLHPTGRYCARCTYPLSYRQIGQVYIDQCYRCGGSFLDFQKAGMLLGEKSDPRNWPKEALACPAWPSQLMCPAGHGRMWAHLLRADDKKVEIDSCPHCYSLWLDTREAEALAEITAEAKIMNARPGAGKGTIGVVAVYLLQLATTIPIEVHNPLKRWPVLIYSLVALLFAIFGLEIFMNVSGQGDAFIYRYALVPAKIAHGENLWALLTHAFLHGGIMHILGNVYFLWIFGDNVEDRLGRGRFTLLYLTTAIIAGLTHALPHWGSMEPMVGASGAIAGLMGAYFILFPRVKLWIVFFFVQFKVRAVWYMLAWVGLQFLIMLDKKSNVAWLAHVGGFASGALLGWLLKPKDDPIPEAPPAAMPR